MGSSTRTKPEQATERLEARVPAQIKALIGRAASLEGQTLTDYVIATLRKNGAAHAGPECGLAAPEAAGRRAGWRECTPENAERFSAVPYLYGMFLHRYLKVPVGIINVARGGTTGDTWCLREELDRLDHVTVKESLRVHDAETATWDDPAGRRRVIDEWERAKAEAQAAHPQRVAAAKAAGKPEPMLRLPKEPQDPRSGWSPPAGLFNATVMPIRWLALRGVLYYQGENNVFMRWTRYEHTFPKVPLSFRKAFGDPTLPLGCISQPGWGTFGTDPEVETVTGGYAIIRDIQQRALKNDPNAGLIATYPTGNSYIHPGEKLPVAEYASLWALAKVYGKPVVHRGNEYRKMVIKDGKAYVFFDADPLVYERWKHIKDNAAWQVLPQPYQGSAPIEGFIIAGNDRRWYPATAQEKKLDGTWTIEVSSDLVPEPVAVRYGWASWPTGNLVGRGNLPAPTFRTDDWPLTEGVRYSEEARKAAEANIKALQEQGARFALDRKLANSSSTCRNSTAISTRATPPASCIASSRASRLPWRKSRPTAGSRTVSNTASRTSPAASKPSPGRSNNCVPPFPRSPRIIEVTEQLLHADRHQGVGPG